MVAKYRGNKPAKIPLPEDAQPMIRLIPLKTIYPSVDVANLLVADHVPVDEKSYLKRFAVNVQLAMNRRFSQMQPSLPSISEDPYIAIKEAFTTRHNKCFRSPQRPADLDSQDMSMVLGALAVRGPFSGYLEKRGGELVWDLLALNKYEVHSGLRKIGARVTFEDDGGILRAVMIETDQGTCSAEDSAWSDATRVALCAVSTHTTLIRHFNWVHLVAGGPIAVATRNRLEGRHPVRRLLWPHLFGTQYSNDLVIEPQMRKDGDFPCIFSFTHRGMCNLFSDTADGFRFTMLDPARDASRRNVNKLPFQQDTQENLEELFAVILNHTDRYIQHVYATNDVIGSDAPLMSWIKEVDRLIPGGVDDLFRDKDKVHGLSNLAACIIYLGCVQHELMGTYLWDYQLWTDVIPARIYKNGRREPLDVYQRMVNANFILNVNRTPLTENFSYMGLDADQRHLFDQFQAALLKLDNTMKGRPSAVWRIQPSVLEANINA